MKYLIGIFATWLVLPTALAAACRLNFETDEVKAGLNRGLGATDKESCRKHCALEFDEFSMKKSTCFFGDESLSMSDLRHCRLFNSAGQHIHFSDQGVNTPWLEVLSETDCFKQCNLKNLPEDQEACYWGDKTIFSEIPGDLRRCRRLEGPSDEHHRIPDSPISRSECLKYTKDVVSGLDKKIIQANNVIQWGNEIWGTPTDRFPCLLCRGWPGSCTNYFRTEDECRKDYADAAKSENSVSAIWKNEIIGSKLHHSQLGNQYCRLTKRNGVDYYGDRFDNGNPADCERLCRDKIGDAVRAGYFAKEDASAFPMTCSWDGKSLFVTKNVCADFFRGPAPIVTLVANPKTGILPTSFYFSQEVGRSRWWTGARFDLCRGKSTMSGGFSITWDRRSWGQIPAPEVLAADGSPLITATAWTKKVPKSLRDKTIVLTNSKSPFQDTLDLKPGTTANVDLKAIGKLLMENNLVLTFAKNRLMRASPQGDWLRVEKVYLGRGGFRLIELRADRKAAGIVTPQESWPVDHGPDKQFYVVENSAVLTPLDLPRSVLVDAGDYNGDGQSELIFLSGQTSSGKLTLVSSRGDVLTAGSWGDFEGP